MRPVLTSTRPAHARVSPVSTITTNGASVALALIPAPIAAPLETERPLSTGEEAENAFNASVSALFASVYNRLETTENLPS